MEAGKIADIRVSKLILWEKEATSFTTHPANHLTEAGRHTSILPADSPKSTPCKTPFPFRSIPETQKLVAARYTHGVIALTGEIVNVRTYRVDPALGPLPQLAGTAVPQQPQLRAAHPAPKRRAGKQHRPGLDAQVAPWLRGVCSRRLCERLPVGDERAVKAERQHMQAPW